MSNVTSLSFPAISFRNLETPFQKQGYRDYFLVMCTEDLPDFAGWRKINVRDPKMKGSIPRAIRTSFHDNPDMFMFMNRGIVLSVDSVAFNNKTSTVTITMVDPNLHGLLDGGHTYNIVKDETKNLKVPQYVKVEILEGFSSENITQVVDARNTSNQVKDESLMNLSGEFKLLKKALEGTSYYDQIAFKEFEVDEEGNPKPIDIREVVGILTAFDKSNFNDKSHPTITYRSKAACLKHFKDNAESYKKIYPLAKEMLAIYDHIQHKLPDLYNTVRGQTQGVSGGKFGMLTGVSVYNGKKHSELLFIGKTSKYGVPTGFVYPILGAFRALLEEKAGRYVWGKGLNPIELLNGELGLKLADTIGNFALDAQNPSKTGKSALVWQACYQCAQVEYLTTNN